MGEVRGGDAACLPVPHRARLRSPYRLHPRTNNPDPILCRRSAGDDSAMEGDRRRAPAAVSSLLPGRSNLPADTVVLVIYRDSWWLNILAQAEILALELRDARTGTTIASAEQRWISHIADVPDTLVADAVTQVLGNAGVLAPTPQPVDSDLSLAPNSR
jgi:hypothetical protein